MTTKSNALRVLRGGSWDSYAEGCRSAFRYNVGLSNRDRNVGFRVARDVSVTPDAPRVLRRVLRGGSWDDYAEYCRSANRYDGGPSVRSSDIGFRVVRDVSGKPDALRVLRGGSWSSSAEFCRSANRYGNVPSNRRSYIGFRVVKKRK